MTQAFSSCLAKQASIKTIFEECPSEEARYLKIIELGRKLPPIDPSLKKPESIVQGCQSIVYLHTSIQDGLLYFQAHSEALISAGLAYLLLSTYHEEAPETLLQCPPLFIEELGLSHSLTPGRSNGLASIYLRMKQDAIKALTYSH